MVSLGDVMSAASEVRMLYAYSHPRKELAHKFVFGIFEFIGDGSVEIQHHLIGL